METQVNWQEIHAAKQFLQKTDTNNNISVYDHLCTVLKNVLTERPDNAIDVVEAYAREAACENVEKVEAEPREDLTQQKAAAEQSLKLFNKAEEEEEGGENEEEFEIPLPNVMELAFYFEQAGIGLSRAEIYQIFLHLKSLVFSYPLTSVRFWGKIFGTKANYIIAEVEFNEGEGEEEEAEEEEGEAEEPQDEEGEDGPSEEDELPKAQWKPPPVIPREDHHSGTNTKVFFVCNEPGDAWVKLPHVTPAQIGASRQVRKLLTGNLDTAIISYPPFVGTEANYLRAQIARISAATQISPAGFYMFDDDEEEEEEEAYHESFMPNVDFEGISLKELADSSMTNWVHHTPNILPQGRCSWFNPSEKVEEDFDEEDIEEEEEDESAEAKAEEGPKLLSSVAQDHGLGLGLSSWTTYISSRVLPEYAVAIARSNRWPGAYAFAKGKRFENIYIGWGSKYSVDNYTPPCPPPPMPEYAGGPEITEVEDPSVEEEKALELRQQEAAKAADEMDQMEEDDDDDE